MPLLTLPNEVLDIILDYTLHAAGLRASVELRTTCRRLDELVQDSVFRLPNASLQRVRMGKEMTAKLIRAKMQLGNANERPLCNAINQTVNFLSENFSSDDGLLTTYYDVLIQAAADSMFYWDVVNSLALAKFKPQVAIKENALVAAIGAAQTEVAKSLLEQGAHATAKTRFFGEPVSVAASYGSGDIIALLLNSRDYDVSDHFTYTRYTHAVEAAARAGQSEITLALLGSNRTPEQVKLLEDAVLQAIKSRQESTAVQLLGKRFFYVPIELSNEGANFWLRVTQAAVEYNCQSVLQQSIPKALSTLGEDALALSTEIACRHNNTDIVHLILLHLSEKVPSYFTGALFWAARLGNIAIVNLLLNFLQQDMKAITKALAGAVSGKQAHVISHLFNIVGIDIDSTAHTRLTFTDAIHLLIPSLPPKISYRSDTTTDHLHSSTASPATPKEVDLLLAAIDSGDLSNAIQIFCTFGAENPDDDLSLFSRAFDEAASKDQPDILLYLCENRFPYLISACAESTAILQIFCDFGWNVNEPDYGKFCTRLDTFTQHSYLLRWLLDNGADPCARGGKDITPTSRAITSASLRTVKLLLSRGRGIENGQLLHFAVQRDNSDSLELMEMLLDLGCPINSIMFQNVPESWTYWRISGLGTALYAAAERGKITVVEYLLGRGADPAVASSNGQTALEVAEMKGYGEIVRLLKDL